MLDEAQDRHGQEHRHRHNAVTAMWLVVVKAIGSRPRKFENTMNRNSVMM